MLYYFIHIYRIAMDYSSDWDREVPEEAVQLTDYAEKLYSYWKDGADSADFTSLFHDGLGYTDFDIQEDESPEVFDAVRDVELAYDHWKSSAAEGSFDKYYRSGKYADRFVPYVVDAVGGDNIQKDDRPMLKNGSLDKIYRRASSLPDRPARIAISKTLLKSPYIHGDHLRKIVSVVHRMRSGRDVVYIRTNQFINILMNRVITVKFMLKKHLSYYSTDSFIVHLRGDIQRYFLAEKLFSLSMLDQFIKNWLMKEGYRYMEYDVIEDLDISRAATYLPM